MKIRTKNYIRLLSFLALCFSLAACDVFVGKINVLHAP
jgi:hypothetical protein